MSRLRLLMAALLLLPSLALAQVEILSPTTVREAIPRPDGSITYRFDRYWNDHYFQEGGTWKPVQVDWLALGGKWGITNGTYVISLDSATQVLRIQRGDHVIKSRLAAVGYYDPLLDSVRVLASYSPGAVQRTGRKATRADYFPGVDVQWVVSRNGLKEYWKIGAAARAAIPTPASLGLSNAQSRLVFATELWVDSLNATAQATEGLVDWVNARTTSGPLKFFDAKDSMLFQMVEAYAWVPDLGGDTTQRSQVLPLQSRIGKRNGKVYLLQGARATEFAALPAGPLLFDPPHNFTLSTDEFLYSPAGNQHDNNGSDISWQVGWISAPTFTAMRDTLFPTGDYTPEMWNRSTGSDSWALLDETTPNSTDYISTTTQYDTTILTYQDLAPSLDVNFHVFDSMQCIVYLYRGLAGDSGWCAIIADTTGNGVNDFFRVDSVWCGTSYAQRTIKLFNERTITASDSLKVGIVTLWNPSGTIRVSWLVCIPYWQKINADGSVAHEFFTLPGTLNRGTDWVSGLPLAPDSGFLWLYLPKSYTKMDSLLNVRLYGCVMGDDPDVSGHTDWVHRNHASRPWKAEGGKWTTQLFNETSNGADVYGTYTARALDSLRDTGWVSIRIPDTVVFEQWYSDLTGTTPATGMILMPDPRESGNSRRQGHSLDNTNDPYASFYCTVRKPRIQVAGFANGDTVRGFGRYELLLSMKPDSSEHSSLDSAIGYYKYLGQASWVPLWNYLGPLVSFPPFPDTSITNMCKDTLGADKPNCTIWDWAPDASVTGKGLFPNTQGPCSLMFCAYTAKGNGDTLQFNTWVDSAFWMITTCDNAVHVDSNAPTFNFGAAPRIRVGKQRNTLFRVTGLPTPTNYAGEQVYDVRRILRMTKKGALSPSPMTFMAARMDSSAWVQGDKDSAAAGSGQVTWDSYKSGVTSWVTPGGDMDIDSLTDSTIVGFVGSSEQYAYLDVTDLKRSDSINAGLKLINGPRDVMDFYPIGYGGNGPAILTVWRTAALRSGDASLWVQTGTIDRTLAEATTGGVTVTKSYSVTGMVNRPKIVLFWISCAFGSGAISWTNTYQAMFGLAMSCERVGGDGLLCVGFMSLDEDNGADGVNWAGMGTQSNFGTPGDGRLFHVYDGYADSADVWLTGYTADGFNYNVRFDTIGGTTANVNMSSVLRISYMAIGGTDISRVDAMVRSLSRTNTNFTTSSFSMNAPTFKPSAMITLWQGAAARSSFVVSAHALTGGAGPTMGFMDSTGDAIYCGGYWKGQRAASDTARNVFNREWDYYEYTTVDVEAEEAVRCRFAGFTTTGFDISAAQDAQVATGSSNAAFMYIAVRGGKWDAAWANGKNISEGTTQSIATPLISAAPLGAIFVSAGMPDTVKEFQDNTGAIDGAADTMWVGGQTCWGAYDGTNQFAMLPSCGFMHGSGALARIDMAHVTNRASITYHQRATTPTAFDEAVTATAFTAGNVNFSWAAQRGATLTASDIGVFAIGKSTTTPVRKKRVLDNADFIGTKDDEADSLHPGMVASSGGDGRRYPHCEQ